MFCRKCGQKLRENDVFCCKCGNKIINDTLDNSQSSISSMSDDFIGGHELDSTKIKNDSIANHNNAVFFDNNFKKLALYIFLFLSITTVYYYSFLPSDTFQEFLTDNRGLQAVFFSCLGAGIGALILSFPFLLGIKYHKITNKVYWMEGLFVPMLIELFVGNPNTIVGIIQMLIIIIGIIMLITHYTTKNKE